MFKIDRIAGIEALRFFLSISVFLHHYFWFINGKKWTNGSSTEVFYYFQFAVDVFFFLTGFFVIQVLQKLSPVEFLRRRAVRILPLYVLVTFILFCVLAFIPGLIKNNPTENTKALFYSLVFLPYSEQNGWQGPILSVGWSLNYEVWFYLTMAIFHALFNLKQVGYLLLSLSLMALFNIWVFGVSGYFFVLFIVGGLIGFAKYYENYGLTLLLFVVSIFTSLVSIFTVSQNKTDLLHVRGLVMLGPSLAVFFLVAGFSINSKACKTMGQLSYPVYLIHLPALYLVSLFVYSDGFLLIAALFLTLVLAVFWNAIQARIEDRLL